MEASKATVLQLFSSDPLTSELQNALYKVICEDRFDHLQLCQTVGILEFLKWNLINRA